LNLEFALSEKPIELDSNPRKEKHDYAGRHGGGRRVGPGGRHRGAGHPEGGEASHAGSHSRINSGWIIDTHRKRITVTSVSGKQYRGTISLGTQFLARIIRISPSASLNQFSSKCFIFYNF